MLCGVALNYKVCYNRKTRGDCMNKVMYCELCGKICYMLFSKKCKSCGSKMKLLSEELKYKYHIFVEDWTQITKEEMILRKENFVMTELKNNPIFSIEEYEKQVQNQKQINEELEEYHRKQNDEQQNEINQQAQKILDKQNCIPKCPVCGSTNIKKITMATRAVKTATFGVAGAVDDAGKTYKCENCGSKF